MDLARYQVSLLERPLFICIYAKTLQSPNTDSLVSRFFCFDMANNNDWSGTLLT
jgi:hypothetical protein